MRRLGELRGKRRAERLRDYLAAQNIETELREDSDEDYTIWVFDEDQVDAAAEHFRAFQASPDAAAFDAPKVVKPEPKKAPKVGNRGRHIDVRTEVFGRSRTRQLPVTMTLIALSGLATLLMSVPAARSFIGYLYFSESFGRDFPEIMHGEVWRIITPIFMHGGMLHLLFNMLWIYQLGGAIETSEGSVLLGLIVFLTGTFANVAQYLLVGPAFVGMSGVVYALFGYIWMMSRQDSETSYHLPQQTVIVMLGWMIACIVGLIPGVANTEHVAGLIAGVGIGFLRAK